MELIHRRVGDGKVSYTFDKIDLRYFFTEVWREGSGMR
jgi:hypothetical protein